MSDRYSILAYDNHRNFRGFVALTTGKIELTYDEPYRCSKPQAEQIARKAQGQMPRYRFTVEASS